MGFSFCLAAKRIVFDTDDHIGLSLRIGFSGFYTFSGSLKKRVGNKVAHPTDKFQAA
ncbi:MAG: hypothetical protein J5680_06960 [Neisseriaceae bacterium]|nr:hypothetical protein [Neisseriaceae bacterium]